MGPRPSPPPPAPLCKARLKPVVLAQIAVEGCCHGDLDKIYATLQSLETAQRKKIDLLICCGDFQARSHVADGICSPHLASTYSNQRQQ